LAYLGAFEQLILFSVLQLQDGAYGVSIRENIEQRTGRTVSIGAIYTTLGRLEERGLVRSRTEEPQAALAGRGSATACPATARVTSVSPTARSSRWPVG